MAIGQYEGVDGIARKVTKRYRGVSGVARRLVNGYVGVEGIARQYWTAPTIEFYTNVQAAGADITTLHDAFAGVDGDTWRFYADATCTKNTDVGRAHVRARIKNFDFEGKTINITYSSSGGTTYGDHVIIFYTSEGTQVSYTLLANNSGGYTSRTIEIPSGTDYITLGISCGAEGRRQMEQTISALTIGDYVFV